MIDGERLAGFLAAAGFERAAAVLDPLEPEGPAVWAGNPDADVYPASMLKTPLSAAALVLVDRGELALESRFAVEQANMTVNDKPSPLVPGYTAALAEIIALAITRSDNVGTNMLYDIVGRERASGIAREIFGLGDTAFHRKLSGADPLIVDPQWDGKRMNRHSARDAARLFRMIKRSEVPYAQFLLDLLSKQEWNNKLSEGLRAGDRFAHKTGDTDSVTHDGGILKLDDGREFVLVVYAAMPSNDENNARFAAFMRLLRAA
ncbi:MAG TPA: serine hydrolase [Candidatus Baltobacteraceae bacterium]|nr:serine hydrolase [Candidatus Baltobacteraceae bacterium]